MANIEIYTRPFCTYCDRAKTLLHKKGATFIEIHAWMDSEKRSEMSTRTGGHVTFPQIFIDDRHIGGCDDLIALDRQDKLAALLG